MDGLAVKDGRIILYRKLGKDETYKVNQKENIFTLAIYKKPLPVVGISSMCQDGKHILFLDYDNIAKWIVIEDIKHLIKKYYLPSFYLFATKVETIEGVPVGNFHAICLVKQTPEEIYAMQMQTHCDGAYHTMPLRNIFRSWVLRVSTKGNRSRPKFITLLRAPDTCCYDISSAHLELLQKIYRLPKVEYKRPDNLKKVYKNVYETLNW